MSSSVLSDFEDNIADTSFAERLDAYVNDEVSIVDIGGYAMSGQRVRELLLFCNIHGAEKVIEALQKKYKRRYEMEWYNILPYVRKCCNVYKELECLFDGKEFSDIDVGGLSPLALQALVNNDSVARVIDEMSDEQITYIVDYAAQHDDPKKLVGLVDKDRLAYSCMCANNDVYWELEKDEKVMLAKAHGALTRSSIACKVAESGPYDAFDDVPMSSAHTKKMRANIYTEVIMYPKPHAPTCTCNRVTSPTQLMLQ